MDDIEAQCQLLWIIIFSPVQCQLSITIMALPAIIPLQMLTLGYNLQPWTRAYIQILSYICYSILHLTIDDSFVAR